MGPTVGFDVPALVLKTGVERRIDASTLEDSGLGKDLGHLISALHS